MNARLALATVATAGGLLVGAPAWAQDVAVLGATSQPGATDDVVASIGTVGVFGQVNEIDVAAGTPALADLEDYAAVFVYNDGIAWDDAAALGNVLADYVDQGGGVVLSGRLFTPNYALEGRWRTGAYSPLDSRGRWTSGDQMKMAFTDASDTTLRFVRWVYGGVDSSHAIGTSSINNGIVVAEWPNDQAPWVARTFSVLRGNVVAINMDPVSDSFRPDSWRVTFSDGEQLFASSLLYAAGLSPVCANSTLDCDINCNSVDASDEAPVDLTDPDCRFWFEERGYNTADFYYQYETFGCLVPILEIPPPPMMPPPDGEEPVNEDDPPGDCFVRHDAIPVPASVEDPTNPNDGTYTTVSLVCDNCPTVINPDQQDGDCDNIGNPCDLCPTMPDPLTDPLSQMDQDMDGVGDACDNCLRTPNPDQADDDFDGVGDACDNCPGTYNPDQLDGDADGLGDECDNCIFVPNDQADGDGDGFGDACDVCFELYNPRQDNNDEDIFGDACDVCAYVDDVIIDATGETCLQEDAGYVNIYTVSDGAGGVFFICQLDTDGDGVGEECDNCVDIPNTLQFDSDQDGIGDACDNCPLWFNEAQVDSDLDAVGNACDNCPGIANGGQRDQDGDLVGDACDNCALVFNKEQLDRDEDGFGDRCDVCPLVADPEQADNDLDGIGDACDNCPNDANPDQADDDDNGVGDICDIQVRGGGESYSALCGVVPGGAAPVGWLLTFSVGLLALRRRDEETSR